MLPAPSHRRGPRHHRGRRSASALAATFLLAAAGCAAEPDSSPPRIVLISIDSLRADRLGSYGAERETSPAIDALAAEGARFRHAVAPTSWTLPSHVTLFTGLPIPAHRVRTVKDRIDPHRQLLARHLADLGYRTAAFVSAPFLHRAYGFDRGFEIYDNFPKVESDAVPPPRELHDESHAQETAPEVVDAALRWLTDRPVGGEEPWLLFVHLWDVHYDYIPPAPYDAMFDPDYQGSLDVRNFERNPAISPDMDPRDLEHLRARYDGEIRWLDSQLARLFDALRAREPEERILVALVADHGDEFFEHGSKGHMKALYEESVRVPWIVRYPGVVPAGEVIEGVAGLDDVAPTLLGLAGLPPLPEATGQDLSAALIEGEAVNGTELLTLGGQVALRGPGWKVHLEQSTGYAVYYDLAADPGEQAPQPARRAAPEKLEALADRLREATGHAARLDWSDEKEAVELDERTRQRLRSLGYTE